MPKYNTLLRRLLESSQKISCDNSASPRERLAAAHALTSALTSIAGNFLNSFHDKEFFNIVTKAARVTPDDEVAKKFITSIAFLNEGWALPVLEEMGHSYEKTQRWILLCEVAKQIIFQLEEFDHVDGRRWCRMIAEHAPVETAVDGLTWYLYGRYRPNQAQRWVFVAEWTLNLLSCRPEVIHYQKNEDYFSLARTKSTFPWRLLLTNLSPIAWRLSAAIGDIAISSDYLFHLLDDPRCTLPAQHPEINSTPELVLLRPWGRFLPRAKQTLKQALKESGDDTLEARKNMEKWLRALNHANNDTRVGELACVEIRKHLRGKRICFKRRRKHRRCGHRESTRPIETSPDKSAMDPSSV